MKKIRAWIRIAALALLWPASACATDPTSQTSGCNVADQRSVCHVNLTVQEISILNAAFEKAPMPHETWGPVWQDIYSQIQAQQPKASDKKQ